MIRGACIAIICLAIGGYFGHLWAMSDVNKMATEAQRKLK